MIYVPTVRGSQGPVPGIKPFEAFCCFVRVITLILPHAYLCAVLGFLKNNFSFNYDVENETVLWET